jgi:hypothetical protein
MNRTRNLARLAAVVAIPASIGFAVPALADGGVHHPCSGPSLLWKDYSHEQNTPAAGVVHIKAGNQHYNVGFQPAGWDVPSEWNGKATSHHDGCGEDDPDPTTTTVPETTTTIPETTVPVTTVPETTTTAPVVTTTQPIPTTTDPEPTTTTEPTEEPTTTTAPATPEEPGRITGEPECGAFRLIAFNPNDHERFVIEVHTSGAVDSSESITILAGERTIKDYTFAEDTGEYVVQVEANGEVLSWVVESDCEVNTEIIDPPAIVAPSVIVADPAPVVDPAALPETR